MQDRLAYWNGRRVDASEVRLDLNAAAMIYGASVTERLRTFGGRLFCLDRHLKRLRRSLEFLGIGGEELPDDLATAAEGLVNEALRREGVSELGLVIVVWPPPPETLGRAESAAPKIDVVMHTHRLEFERWASCYAEGVRLTVSSVRQVPKSCWPRALKCRSRMHYYLAIREAAARQAGTVPLLLDEADCVTETPTANVAVFSQGQGFRVPPADDVLPGVSLGVLRELAAEAGLAWQEQPLRLEDVYAADEVMLTSTPYCMLPVVQVDGRPIGSGSPGPVFRRLLDVWSRRVGIDIAAQAVRGA